MKLSELAQARLSIPEIVPHCAIDECPHAVGFLFTASFPEDLQQRRVALCPFHWAQLKSIQSPSERPSGTWPTPCPTFKEVKP